MMPDDDEVTIVVAAVFPTYMGSEFLPGRDTQAKNAQIIMYPAVGEYFM